MNKYKNPKRASGQAMVYLIVMLGVVGLGLAYAYNSGQLVNEKTRLQNTTDAVAYSIATVEARDLNFKAYTNRAMVANQVAIAQTVGLVSWTRWLQITIRNIDAVTQFIPWIGAVIKVIKNIVEQVGDVVIDALIKIVAPALELVMFSLENSQLAMHGSTLAAAQGIARNVARQNDPDIDLSFNLRNAAWAADYVREHNRMTRRFTPDAVRNNSRTSVQRRSRAFQENKARMDEFRNITMASRDGFSTDRGFRPPLLPRLWLGDTQLEFRKDGGTTLVSDHRYAQYGSWISMDTFSLQRRSWNFGWGRWKEVWPPIGWGAARNDRSGENIYFNKFRGREHVGGSWKTNPRASWAASAEFQSADRVEGKGLAEFKGLRSFYDLTLDGLVHRGPEINILLSKPRNRIRTTTEIGSHAGNTRVGADSGVLNIEHKAATPGDRIHSISKATAYFARMNDAAPQRRKDGMREYGNLYNPYWQARLEPMNDSEKRALQLIVLPGI